MRCWRHARRRPIGGGTPRLQRGGCRKIGLPLPGAPARRQVGPMSSIANQRREMRLGVNRALDWWLGELRSVYGDAARKLSALSRNTLTIEAGERHWRLRRREALVGEIDWATGEPGTGRHLLRELAARSGRPATILVEIP